jgi:uncharacterized protein with PQ loop repeat
MGIALLAVAAWQLLAILIFIANIGKPREVTTPTVAAISVLINLVVMAVLIVAAIQLL